MAARKQTPHILIDTIADSWCRRNRPESMNTDWGQSLLAYGLLRAVETTGNANAREYLRRWVTYHLAAGVPVTYFVGSWSIGLLYPGIVQLFPEFQHEFRALATRIYTVIREKAIRNGNGVILHNVDLPHIYIDTVYYSAPILARLAEHTGATDWKEEALHQLRQHLALLHDPATGFSIHCEQNLSGHRSEGDWGRGNGWIAMTCGELLPSLRKGSREWNEVATILRELLAKLAPHQTRAGLWRTIITDKTSYEETSASAMFLFGILRARKYDIIGSEYDETAERCARGLRKYVDADGRLMGCSEGTWPGTVEYYKGLERGEWWWGTGAYLLALTEAAALNG